MTARSRARTRALEDNCAIARSLGVLADPWSFLIIRETLFGRRTFAEFRDSLGIATDVLTDRLGVLVEHGVLQKVPYRAPQQRTRWAYEPTPAGHDLNIVLAALQQWGAAHLPRNELTVVPTSAQSGHALRVAFVDAEGRSVSQEDAQFSATARSDIEANPDRRSS